MKYVSEGANALAREMEAELCKLPAPAGILFASVSAVPEEEGVVTSFEVVLGIRRIFEEGTGVALIQTVLGGYIKAGVDIRARVYRGISGAGRDEGLAAARPVAS